MDLERRGASKSVRLMRLRVAQLILGDSTMTELPEIAKP